MVRDRLPGTGALGGLYTALVEAPTERVLVLACDMPFVTAPFLEHLAALGDGTDEDVIVPRDSQGQRHPLCACYHRRIAVAIRQRLDAGQLRVLDALNGLSVRDVDPDETAPFDSNGRLLLNVNTPADYEGAQRGTTA